MVENGDGHNHPHGGDDHGQPQPYPVPVYVQQQPNCITVEEQKPNWALLCFVLILGGLIGYAIGKSGKE